MRKYLAATVLGAMLMAGQAAAYDNGIVSVGDRIGSSPAAADNMEGMGGGALWFTLAAFLVIGVVTAIALDQGTGNPGTP